MPSYETLFLKVKIPKNLNVDPIIKKFELKIWKVCEHLNAGRPFFLFNQAYFALYLGGTSSLEHTPVPLAAYSLRTVYLCLKYTFVWSEDAQLKCSFTHGILFNKLILTVEVGKNNHIFCLHEIQQFIRQYWLQIGH